METKQIKAYGVGSATDPIKEMSIKRRAPQSKDIEIEISYCGICHSDLHIIKNDFGRTTYPVVPGHEIVGKVVSVGNEVKNFKVGDLAAIGCIVNSCRQCEYCDQGVEQFCSGMILTFNSKDEVLGGMTYGGYSKNIVCDEKYVLHVPKFKDLAATAPLLCAGITVYSPLSRLKAGPGKRVGVIGIGGLGHMADRKSVV